MSLSIIALDQGTTSSRAVSVIDGQIGKIEHIDLHPHFPQPGFVELDAEEILSSQITTLKKLMTRVKPAAIGITNQRETTIVWDRATGKALAPAIVWQDRRGSALCDKLRAHETMIHRKTGLVLDPYFSATKMRWILDNVDVRKKDIAFGTVDSWLVWHLSGGRDHITDKTNASRTMLMNLETMDWDEELLQLFGIARSTLPRIVESSGNLSSMDGIPITGIAGDQQASLFGQRALAKCTFGTGCFLLVHTGKKPFFSPHLLTTVACDGYALEGSAFMGGALVQWLRDELKIIRKSSEIGPLAASDSNGVILVPSFTGLGAPYWNPHARGALFGLTRGTTQAHIARAALEGIAWEVTDLFEACSHKPSSLHVDGGACQDNTLMQIQANFLGVPLHRPKQIECTALGAALLAARGAWDSLAHPTDRTFIPALAPDIRNKKYAQWKQAVALVQQI